MSALFIMSATKIAHRKRDRRGQFFWKGRDNEPSI